MGATVISLHHSDRNGWIIYEYVQFGPWIVFTCNVSKPQKRLSIVKSKILGINVHFYVNMNFYVNQCDTKNAVGV